MQIKLQIHVEHQEIRKIWISNKQHAGMDHYNAYMHTLNLTYHCWREAVMHCISWHTQQSCSIDNNYYPMYKRL